MTCPNGHPNAENQRFCGECGTAIRPSYTTVIEGMELPDNQGFFRATTRIIHPNKDDAQASPPGWYPNPSGAPGQRYWNGTGWADAQAARGPTQSPKLTTWPPMPPRRVTGIVSAAIILLVAIAVSIHHDTERQRTAGQSSTTSETSATQPVPPLIALPSTAAPTTTAPAPAPAGLMMPPGSKRVNAPWCQSCDYPHEEWQSGLGVAETVAWLRARLPIGADLEGVPWCVEDSTVPGWPMWMWEGAPGSSKIEIGVEAGSDVEPGYAEVTIEKESGSSVFGCHDR